jgi:hypothetical protein
VLGSFDLRLRTWSGAGYIVTRCDGPSELAPSLGAVWAVAERASGAPCDPLDPALIQALQRD